MFSIRFAAVIIAGFLALDAAAQGRPAGVGTELVSTAEMAETVAVFGQVVAGRESAVAARVGGVADSVPIRVGDVVREGDLLTQMDTELLEIEVAAAEAEIEIAEAGVEVAKALLEEAESAFRRAERLRANSTIAEAQLEDRAGDFAQAVGTRGQAAARYRAARTALARARYNLNNATVRAPFGGVILEVTTEIGQFVGAGTQVATMVDVDSMEVEANVPSRFVDALQQGLEVSARGDSGRPLPLVLRAILPTEFSSTRTRPVRFDIADNTGGQVAVGQAVTLQVPISAPRDVTVVPKDALVQGRGGGWMVFLNLEGKATPRPVEIGAALEGGFEVLSGLQPGDEVVVRGNERLRPGQDIQPMNAGTPPGGSQGGQRGEPAAGSGETAGRQRAQATN